MKLNYLVPLATFSGLASLAGAQVNFSDNFNPPSNLWSNTSGNWTASGGDYYAQQPNNDPFAASWLPYDLTDFTVNVTVNNLGDGGILLRGSGLAGGGTNGPSDTVTLILGGDGYGQGYRGGNAGTAAYWAVDGNGSVDEVDGVFTPGDTYNIKVTVTGDTYSLYVNGSSTPTTTLTTSLNPSGYTGLYDDQPNTTTASGSGAPTSFSNYSLTGTPTPEPSSLAFFGLGMLALPFLRKRRR